MRTSLIGVRTPLARTLSLIPASRTGPTAAFKPGKNAGRSLRGSLFMSALLFFCSFFSEAQVRNEEHGQIRCYLCPPPDVSVLTHHNDNARTGAQLAESTLSPQSIKANGGLIMSGSANITGVVNAQPLYVQGVPFQNGTIDLVYVVDSTNTVYAFSPSLALFAIRSLEPATGGSTVDAVGILSTPAIDKARNLMYVVVRASDSSPAPFPYGALGNAKFILHALDLVTLGDKFPPTTISASVPVPAGVATFVPIVERQRTALLLNETGGRSYLSFGFGSMPGSLGEGHPVHYQHGWALTYDVTNAPALANAYLSTRDPDPTEPGGIWQGGAGFAADQFSNVFLATGNADADANHDGDSVVRLTSEGAKFWNAPAPNQAFLDTNDLDLSGGGPIVLPHNSGASRVFVIGKDGSAILVRVYDDIVQNPAIIQSFQAVPPDPKSLEVFWGDPVYWNGHVYYIGSNDYLKSLPWDSSNGVFTSIVPTNISQSPEPPDEPNNSCGHRSLSLSANGASGAILWLARQGAGNCPGVLDAYDPATPNSPPFFHWSAGPGVYLARFPMATVAGGRVFFITVNGVGSTLLEFTIP